MATKPEKPKAVDKPAAGMAITLIEFCERLSTTLRRQELIGAFYFVENRAGRVRDTEAAYRSRFDAFVNTPV